MIVKAEAAAIVPMNSLLENLKEFELFSSFALLLMIINLKV